MAKVMISLPDDLLDAIDAQARSEHETRSGFLRRLAEQRLTEQRSQRSAELDALLERATGNYGGDAVRLIREDRESH